MSKKTFLSVGVCLIAGFCLLCTSDPVAGKDWQPVDPAELAMKDNPDAPGQHAMILARQVDLDDRSGYEMGYERIKIFTDEGKKHGDIEIPYFSDSIVEAIQARTVHPDGKTIAFDGKIFEKVLIKIGAVKLMAKTFSLPEVEPGSVLEYKYRIAQPRYSEWIIQSDLFTRKARFTIRAAQFLDSQPVSLMWTLIHVHTELPKPKEQNDGTMALDLEKIPGLEREDHMPPVDSVRTRVFFFYRENQGKDYWKDVLKRLSARNEEFIGNRGAIANVAKETAAGADSDEAKLKKLYARAQKITNTAAQGSKTAQEQKRVKEASNVEDVLKRGVGTPYDINRFFIAMARAEHLDANVVWVTDRSSEFFDPSVQSFRQLTTELVAIEMGGHTLFLDPGCDVCAYGELPWFETAASGVVLNKQGGGFISTVNPKSADAGRVRKTDLRLSADGTAEGTVVVDFSGHEAVERRLDEDTEDETGRQKYINDELKAWLPAAATVEVTKVTGWDASGEPLHVEAKVKIPAFATAAGRRMIFPVGFYQAGRPALFQPAQRTNPIYFHFPYVSTDDLIVHLPEGFTAESVPPSMPARPGNVFEYELLVKKDGSTLAIHRQQIVEGVLIPVKFYSQVRDFYQNMRNLDEQQVVLQGTPQAASN